MIRQHATEKQLLFDGLEHNLFQTPLQLPAHLALEEPLDVAELDDFGQLKDMLGSDDFASLVRSGDFVAEEGFLDAYKGSDDLSLYYFRNGKTILVFAFGEFQPTRYKLYLEGAWELS